MELPHKLPDNQELRRVLGEFYDSAKDRQWFERAELVENHPTHMKKTLELHCKYNPVLEMKEILSFCHKYDLALEIVAQSHQG